MQMVCLHQLETQEARDVSRQVIKSIYATSFESAQELVGAGLAERRDFWLFFGYCGWGPGQLQAELERDSW